MRTWVLAFLLAASGPCGAPKTSEPAPATPTALAIEPSTVDLTFVGQTTQMKATVTYSNGTRQDQSGAAVWTTGDAAVALVAAGGAVTAVGPGLATISAQFGAVTGSANVRVHTERSDGWTYLGAATTKEESIVVDPRDERLWYVGTGTGLYVTRDAGATWAHPVPGFATRAVLDPENADRVYYCANNGVYRSEDRGVTWNKIASFDYAADSLVVSRVRRGTIYVGTSSYPSKNDTGIYRSTDDGATWTWYSYGAGRYLISWTTVEDPFTGAVFVGAEIADHPQPYHPPFLRSLDYGETWQDVSGSALRWHVPTARVHPVTGALYALTEGAGLYRSVDSGNSWKYLNNNFYLTLEINPHNPDQFFGGNHTYGGRGGGAYVSIDAGEHFTSYGLNGLVVGSFSLNGEGTRLYAACYGSGIYVRDLQ